jgi:hypothetical protein
MASFGMVRRVASVGTDIPEELRASIIRVTRLVNPDNGGANFSETSILTRATLRNIPEDVILPFNLST